MATNRKPKVLYVIDKSGFGGIQTIAYSLIRMPVPGVEVVFFFLRNINSRFDMEDIEEENVFYSKASARYSLRPLWEMAKLLRSGGFDIVHLNGNKSIILGAFLKLIYKKPLIIAHDHGGAFDYKKWYGRLLGWMSPVVDLYVGVSQRRKKFLIEECGVPAKKIQVVDNFVSEDFCEKAKNTKSNEHNNSVFTIGYLGGLSYLKGCDVLIRSIPILKEKLKDFRVVIAGDGSSKIELVTLAEHLGVSPFVTFLGYVDDQVSVYSQFDLMIIPSRSEEGPISLFESWMMGIPVIASDAPVLDERITDYQTGVFFRSGDHNSLAGKVIELFFDKILQCQLVENGCVEAKKYTMKKYHKSLYDLYSCLLNAQ